MLDEAKMRRLAMIQYTYTLAVDQCQKPEPFNMVALQLFYDVVELFLLLASEYLHAGKAGREFLEYWEAINQKLPAHDFGHKDSMNRLSKARSNWKHHGIRISTAELEEFRSNVTTFFRDNTPKVFGIDFEGISMVLLVQTEEVRNRLTEAERLSSAGEIKAALRETAIAFQDLMNRFEWGIRDLDIPHAQGFTRPIFSRVESAAPRELSRFAKEIDEEFATLHEQIKLLSIGIDYRRCSCSCLFLSFQGSFFERSSCGLSFLYPTCLFASCSPSTNAHWRRANCSPHKPLDQVPFVCRRYRART